LIDAGHVEDVANEPAQAFDAAQGSIDISNVRFPRVLLGAPLKQLQSRGDGGNEIAQIVRQDRDQLLRYRPPPLFDGVAPDLFDELGAMRDGPHPTSDRHREVLVGLVVEIALLRRDHEYPAGVPRDFDRHAQLRFDFQDFANAFELAGIVAQTARSKRSVRFEYMDHPTTIGDRQNVEPRFAL
jgi:hypothetical protein